MADVRAAAGAEGFSVFHAVSNPLVPVDERPLLQKLAALSADGVQTFLIVDPAVWPGVGGAAGQPPPAAISRIIQSPEWTGSMLLPAFGNLTINVREMSAAMSLPPRLEWLPDSSDVRVPMLRRIFVDTRGRLLRTTSQAAPNAASVPTLKSVNKERV